MLPNVLHDNATDHVPVLAEEVRELLEVQPGETVVDATFGAGGHAAVLAAELRGRRASLIAIDRDPTVRPYFERFKRRRRRPGALPARRGFASCSASWPTTRCKADAILLDLGVSSMQLDRPERGFSYARRRAARHAHGPERARRPPRTSSTRLSERELRSSSAATARSATPARSRARSAGGASAAVRADGRAGRDDQGRDPGAGTLRRRASRPSACSRRFGSP